MSTWVLVRPLPYSIKHGFLNLDTFIPNSWVVKSPAHIIDDFADRHTRVLPSV